MDELRFILTFINTSATVTLIHAPDGWDEQLVRWERSLKYWGMFRSFSIPLKFVKDGALALRTEFYTYGLKSQVNISIERQNKLTFAYEVAYSGMIDFGTWKDLDTYVEVTIIDGGLVKYLKDNEGTEYQIENGNFTELYSLNSVYFYTASKGLAVGNNGVIRKTVNGGVTWTTVASGVTDHLYGVTFKSAVAYICGSNGCILKSTDEGATWTQLTTSSTKDLYCIFSIDDTVIFICGETGTILKTLNAGATWWTLSSGTVYDLKGIAFFDVNNGHCVGAGGTILITTDSGNTWTPEVIATTTDLNSVCYFGAFGLVMAAGNGGTILVKSTTWSWLVSGVIDDLYSIQYAGYTGGGAYEAAYIVGASGTILKTTNGSDCTILTSGTKISLKSVFGISDFGCIVGDDGLILTTADFGATWTQRSLDKTNRYAIFEPTGYETMFCYYSTLLEIANDLIQSLSGGIGVSTYLAKSTYLTALLQAVVLTTGNSIRRAGASGAVNINDGFGYFKTSFEDFFKSLNAFACAGMGVEIDPGTGLEVLRIEQRDFFFENTQIADVGEIKDFKLLPRSEFFYNSIKTGYAEKEYAEGYNSELDAEVNTYSNFEIPTKLKGEYDVTNKYRADWTGMKIIIDRKGENSNSDDEEIFLLSVKPIAGASGNVSIYKGSGKYYVYPVFENCNVSLSPLRNFIAHKRFLDSCMHGFAGTAYNWVSGGKWAQRMTASDPIDGLGWLAEGVPASVVGTSIYFKPYSVSFECNYKVGIIALIQATPNGYITFHFGDDSFKGFILKMEVKLSGKGALKLDLLLAADSDLTKLIR